MKCERVGVRASKCMNKRTKPDWVHTSLELCKCKNKGKCVFRCTESSSVHHREGWFPATLARPQTIFTFDCLETFHELTLQGKTSLYDYYNTLLRRSDNANLLNPVVSLILLSSPLTNSYFNSGDTQRFIASSECGGT